MSGWAACPDLEKDVKTGAECLDGRDRDCGATGYRKRSTPDTNFCAAMEEFLKRLREVARLAEARGEKKKSCDCGYEKEEV